MVKGGGRNSNRFRNLHADIRVLSLQRAVPPAEADGGKQDVSAEMTHVSSMDVVIFCFVVIGFEIVAGVALKA